MYNIGQCIMYQYSKSHKSEEYLLISLGSCSAKHESNEIFQPFIKPYLNNLP